MHRLATLRFAGIFAGALAFSAPASSHARADDKVQSFEEALDDLDLVRARQALDGLIAAGSDQAHLEFWSAQLAFYHANYDEAVARLEPLVAAQALEGAELERARETLRMAKGGAETFRKGLIVKSDDGLFVAAFAHEKDLPLAPYLFEAMKAGDAAMSGPLGVHANAPLRVEILDDPATLALLTTLPLDAVYTTGTVGITKFNRIMMVTPRVLLSGYGWLDTACHEFVHQLVTLRTRNNAPVWLQEGLAKLFESRWRGGDPWDLEVGQSKLLRQALDTNDLVTLEEMHPSIALLPTQERAALAYAEVQTMLALVESARGREGLARLLDEVAQGSEAKKALASAFGTTFETFDQRWRAELQRRIRSGETGEFRQRRFIDASEGPASDSELAGDLFSSIAGGKARQHARIGALLQLGGHNEAARVEYEKTLRLDRDAVRDPLLTRRLGELTLAHGDPKRAAELLQVAMRGDPESATLAILLAKARLAAGDLAGARAAISVTIEQNPFVTDLHCVLAKVELDPKRRTAEQALCPSTAVDAPNRDHK
jgi:tetratricopeptide (TPR) repeat protein